MPSLPAFPPLTEEQLSILQACPPPTPGLKGRGHLMRITAAAGSGKTTTLLALAAKGASMGYSRIIYTTFTKAAATEGAARLRGVVDQTILNARTLHSLAFRLLDQHSKDTQNQMSEVKFWDDKKVQQFISAECREAIDDFVKPCFEELA